MAAVPCPCLSLLVPVGPWSFVLHFVALQLKRTQNSKGSCNYISNRDTIPLVSVPAPGIWLVLFSERLNSEKYKAVICPKP